MAARESIKNMLINGETTTVEIIPHGVKKPNIFKATGAVTIWAPAEADKGLLIFNGTQRQIKPLKKSANKRMPAKAP